MDAIFELVDVWTEGTNVTEYISFLHRLLHDVASGRPLAFKSDDTIGYGGYTAANDGDDDDDEEDNTDPFGTKGEPPSLSDKSSGGMTPPSSRGSQRSSAEALAFASGADVRLPALKSLLDVWIAPPNLSSILPHLPLPCLCPPHAVPWSPF